MADGGLCSEVEEIYGRSRYLKWKDMLLEEKSGNVTEIDVGCNPEYLLFLFRVQLAQLISKVQKGN